MSEPIRVLFFTAAGVTETSFTEEEAAQLPSIQGVISPTSGRPRLAAAVVLHVQQELATAKNFFTIMDYEGKITMMRASHVYGATVDEPIDTEKGAGTYLRGAEYAKEIIQ